MITWNYRVFREISGEYVIREVIYAEDGSIITCTESPVEPVGETFEALAADIVSFQEALHLPVLRLEDIPEVVAHRQVRQQGANSSIEQLLAELNETDEPSDAVASSSGASPKV
jgi:hypothetical protein